MQPLGNLICWSRPEGRIPCLYRVLPAAPLHLLLWNRDLRRNPSNTTVYRRSQDRSAHSALAPSLPRHTICKSRSSKRFRYADSEVLNPEGYRDIELVTQVSLDRWPRFAQQALAWGGPVSVAVYLPCPSDHPLAEAYHGYLRALVDGLRAQLVANDVTSTNTGANVGTTATWRRRLTVSVVHARRLAPEGAGGMAGVVQPASTSAPQLQDQQEEGSGNDGGGGLSYEDLYPINVLRNAALRAASCSHIWLVDGDFIPSRGLRQELLQPTALVRSSSSSSKRSDTDSGEVRTSAASDRSLLDISDASDGLVMWVVPAFEVKCRIPSDSAAATAEVPDSQMAEVPHTLQQLASIAALSGVQGARPRVLASDAHPAGGLDATSTPPTGATTELRPFFCGRYPQPVPSIDFKRWWAAALNEFDNGGGGCNAAAVAATAVTSQVHIAAATTADDVMGDDSTHHHLSVSHPALSAPADVESSDPGWFTVPYHEYFEPYCIARRDEVPLYDERFRGYGLNKVQHAYHLAALGVEFRVLTRHFCVTVPHARSTSYRAVFGTVADPQQRLRVEQLYEQFKQEIYKVYGYRYTAPGAGTGLL